MISYDKDIAKVKEEIKYKISSLNNKYVNDMFEKISDGKYLRTQLIFAIASSGDQSIKLASVIEMIHLASLLHDDVIDNAKIRRSSPTINALYDSKSSIMLGDLLYSKGFNSLSFFNPKIINSVSASVSLLSEGEIIDYFLAKQINTNKNIYLDMIYKKTASLIECSCYSAALISGKDEIKYAKYGKNMGIAYQIIDDILDITIDSKNLGKGAFEDFKEGKTTLPYIYLYEELNLDDKETLKSLYQKTLTGDEVMWLKNKFKEFDIVAKCYSDATHYVELAKNELSIKDVFLQALSLKLLKRKH